MRKVKESFNTKYLNNEEVINKLKRVKSIIGLSISEKMSLDMAIEALGQEPCEDTISRQAVINVIDKWVKAEHILVTLPADKVTPLFKSVHKLSPINPQTKTGHWIDADGDNAICGCCNRLNHLYGTYCKHCGAKMIESQESEE